MAVLYSLKLMTIRQSKQSREKPAFPKPKRGRNRKRRTPDNSRALAVEKIEHDLKIGHVTAERFRFAQEFIRACEKVGAWQLKQGELTDDAGFYIGELASELALITAGLIERGDLMLARKR